MNLLRFQKFAPVPLPRFGHLSGLRTELERFFDSSLAELARASGGWTPALDVHEDKDNFTVKAELPGVKKEDIDISLEENRLSISGERKSEIEHKDAEVHRTERTFGSFQRTLTLPAGVAADKVKAQYKDGVLTITLPKTEEAKPKHIDVSVGG